MLSVQCSGAYWNCYDRILSERVLETRSILLECCRTSLSPRFVSDLWIVTSDCGNVASLIPDLSNSKPTVAITEISNVFDVYLATIWEDSGGHDGDFRQYCSFHTL